MMMTLQQAHAMVRKTIPSARLVGDGSLPISRVHTDSRSLQMDDLFVALVGERFDAHDFLPQVNAQGVRLALAQHGLALTGMSGIEVADSKAALGALAAAWRAQFSLPLIAVTGSNGKTTVTQMIATILRAHVGMQAFATQGNFNNDIGVPLTLLGLRDTHKLAVVELGMNHPGEIATLAAMTAPTVALVNNAQREHLEFMHTIEAVAEENGSVLAYLPRNGVAVFPSDDAYTFVWKRLKGACKSTTFAMEKADVSVRQAHWANGAWQVQADTPAGDLQFSLRIAGQHNVKNALAAAACAVAADVPLASIARGLSMFEPVKGRSRALNLRVGGRELTVVDDTYNANPDSMRAAIDVLAVLPAPRMLVMGDMGEVGDQGPALHVEAMRYAKNKGIEHLLCTGMQSGQAAREVDAFQFYQEMADLQVAVTANMRKVASVLVKGSRFMKMEQVVDGIVYRAQNEKERTHAA